MLMTTTLPTIVQNDVRIISIPDAELSDLQRIETVGSELASALVQCEEKRLLINFREVQFMGSAMIGKIISLFKRCKQHQVDLRFCELNENLMEVFELMQLTKMFEVYPTQESALSAFAK